MNDSILNEPGIQIDARSLNARAAMRGAIGGFRWSLLLAVPVAVVGWSDPRGGPLASLSALGAVCSIWSAIAAFVEVKRTRERTFTDEQRAVLRRHCRRTAILAVGVIVLLVAVSAAIPSSAPVLAPITAMIVLLIAISSDLIGRAMGNAAVREMQQETRHAASLIDSRPLALTDDVRPSILVQSSKERFTETQPAAPLDND